MALRGTNQEFGRPYNRRIVLESIRLHGPTTRGEIAERVGLTVQTVSTIVRELEEQGYLAVRARGAEGPRPAARDAADQSGRRLCGRHPSHAARRRRGADQSERRRRRRALHRDAPNATPDDAFELIGATGAGADQAASRSGRMLGVGMALPGPFGVESMSFVGPTTMAGWKNVAIRERLAEATGLPAFLETDMAAAALGEQLYGLGNGFLRILLPLSSASGLAAPWCMTARVLRGAWGNAGEIGHIPVVPDGEPCPCGNRGCLERYVSLEALQPPPSLSEADWVRAVAPIFRNAIATIENLFDPETMVAWRPGAGRAARTPGSGWRATCRNSISARRDRDSAARDRRARRRSTRCCAARPRLPCRACCRRASARCSRATASATCSTARGSRHDANRCWCSTTSARITARSKR